MTKPRWFCNLYQRWWQWRGQLYTVGYYFRVGKTIVRITLKKTK